MTRGIGVSALEWNLDHLHHPLLCPKLYQNRRLTHLTKSADDPNGMKLRKAKRGSSHKFRCLQFNNFVILTLFEA